MEGTKLSTISKATSDEKIGEFWDRCDFTEFDSDATDVAFEVISTDPVELDFAAVERLRDLSNKQNEQT